MFARGRRGLGLQASALQRAVRDVDWKPEDEVVSAKEEVHWLEPCPQPVSTLGARDEWVGL